MSKVNGREVGYSEILGYSFDEALLTKDRSSGFYRAKREWRGWVEIDGMAFAPFVGNLLLVRTRNGHRFLVDRWGRVTHVTAIEGDILTCGTSYDPVRTRGYDDGIAVVVEMTTKCGGRYGHRMTY